MHRPTPGPCPLPPLLQCPPQVCGDLAPQKNVDLCCDSKGIFTDDRSCPLTVCYDYETAVDDMTAVFKQTVLAMDATDNATEVRAAHAFSQTVCSRRFLQVACPGLRMLTF